MALAVGGAMLTPLDRLLEGLDRKRLAQATAPTLRQLFICGAPRSGTTLVYQTLIRALPVAWFANLVALFPRTPLTATRLWGTVEPHPNPKFRSYYGRTGSPRGSTDALELWDRWLGSDRTRPAPPLDYRRQEAMIKFFGAYEQISQRPLVAKNNSLNVNAHLVASVLPTAAFFCLRRDPALLAQSLLQARRDIHGNERVPYGVLSDELRQAQLDPIDHVCHQALYYEETIREQVARIGPERFVVVSYEEFCADPGRLLHEAAHHLLGRAASPEERARIPVNFTASRRIRNPEEFRRIEARIRELGGRDRGNG